MYVGKLIVSKYVAESINNWLQDVLAMKAFVSCILNSMQLNCMQLTKAFVVEMSCNQLSIDSATYFLTINSPTLKSIAVSLNDNVR